jgi:hypothetical protein
VADCDTCRPGPVLDRYCPRYFEHLAHVQAETINAQAGRIQELIRQANDEKVKADRAFTIATGYARQAGVDITEDDVRGHAEHDDRLIELYARKNHRLDGFHDAIVRTLYINYLQKLQGVGLSAEELGKVCRFISSAADYANEHASAKPSTKQLPAPPKTAQPTSPAQPQQFEDVALFEVAS